MKLHFIKYAVPLLTALHLGANQIYTVDDLIVQALENSPNLQISTTNIESSRTKVQQANSSYLPLINLHLSAGQHSMTNVPSSDMIDDTLVLGSLSLKQLIYDFGKISSNVAGLKYDVESLNHNNEQSISDKILDVKLAYYNILQALALINVHKENVLLNEKQLYRSQKYFEAGIRTKIDISDAKVELIKAKLDLKTVLYDLKLAYATLDNVIGLSSISNNYTVFSKPLKLDNLYESLSQYTLTLRDSIEFAYSNKSALKSYDENIKAATSQIEQASSNYYPELYFGADYTKQKVDTFSNVVPEDQWSATVNLDWNIYEGGATTSKEQEKRLQRDAARLELNNLKLSIKKLTTEAYIDIQRAKDTVELSQSLLEVSKEKFDQASKRYEHGLSDYIELQQSRQGYIDAKASLVVNYYTYYQAIASLDNAIGK